MPKWCRKPQPELDHANWHIAYAYLPTQVGTCIIWREYYERRLACHYDGCDWEKRLLAVPPSN